MRLLFKGGRSFFGTVFLYLLCTVAMSRELDLESIKPPNDGKGIVLVSLTASGTENFNHVTFNVFQPSFTQYKIPVSIGRPLFSIQENLSSADGRFGRLVALALEPGQWKFGEVAAVTVDNRQRTNHALSDVERPFTVEANKITYLGNLDVVIRREPSFQAAALAVALLVGVNTSSSPSNSIVFDARENDMKLLKAKNPGLDTTIIATKLISDKRDTKNQSLRIEYEKRAAQNDALAQGFLDTANAVGAVQLPDFQLLRAPATQAHDKNNFKRFLQSGDPKTVQWALSQSTTTDQTIRSRVGLPQEIESSWVEPASFAYSREAISTLLEELKNNGDEKSQKAWAHRADWLGHITRKWYSNQMEALIGADAYRTYNDLKADRKILLTAATGFYLIHQDDGKSPLQEFISRSIEECSNVAKVECMLAYVNRWVIPRDNAMCPASYRLTGIASTFPPINLPSSTDVATNKPWAAQFKQWQDSNEAHKGFPRTFVWDNGLGRGFGRYGDCASAYRAVASCVKEGGKQCDVVVQDDKITEGSESANRMKERLLSYQMKQQ
jgi:hypothetical protein